MVAANFKPHFKSIFLHVLAAIVILFLLVNFIATTVKIKGSSMQPILQDQERIIILKLGLTKNHIDRFDIIVFSIPDINHKKLIKRVIGLPNEQIEIRGGEIYINNRILKQHGGSTSSIIRADSVSIEPIRIPENHYFVIGDNPCMSQDSREFGLIPRTNIIGKAILRYWPFSRFGKIS